MDTWTSVRGRNGFDAGVGHSSEGRGGGVDASAPLVVGWFDQAPILWLV